MYVTDEDSVQSNIPCNTINNAKTAMIIGQAQDILVHFKPRNYTYTERQEEE
jgi:hypothetical protein